MSIANGLALPNPLSNGTTADAVPVMADFNYLLSVVNRALLDQGGSAGMNAQSTQIHNLSNGTAANDAINLSQITNAFLPLGGGTLTGGLLGTTLSLSSTLSVTGASTSAALTASGLITGNAGFSGTTLNLTGAASLAGISGTTLSLTGAATLSSTLTLNVPIQGNSGLTINGPGAAGSGNPILVLSDPNNSNGANFKIVGNGATTPSKYVRVISGALTIMSDAYAAILTLSDSGNTTLAGSLGATSGSFSSTLSVSGASTLAALTASGLITGNGGFSGTTLNLSSTLGVTGQTTLGNVTGTPNGSAANSLGYLGLPQNPQTASYTLVLADAGKYVYLSGTTAGQTVTIPTNATVAFARDVSASIVNDSNQTWTLAPAAGVTLKLAGGTATGNRNLVAGAVATILKVGTDTWYVSGAGVN